MEIPCSVLINETKNNIVNVINTSGLHLSILQYLIKDIYVEVNNAANELANKEKATYEASLTKENENHESKDPQ